MAKKETPVMRQHAAAKAAHPDCVVFFRLGDFYEMFGDDAVLVSEVLDLTLTSRNKGKADEIPMAGVPHHAAHGYIARMLKKGHKVAICEQMADPSTVKGIVPREVVRVITPGTWNNEAEQAPGENNWLCAVELTEEAVGIAFLDLSTAELMAASVPDLAGALSEIGRTGPREILVGAAADVALSVDDARSTLAELNQAAQVRVDQSLSPSARKHALAGVALNLSSGPEQAAAARVLRYARDCFRGKDFPVWRVAHWNPTGFLGLDRAAQQHLELVESSVGDTRATLLHVLDKTGSPGGARLLRRRLLAPLTDLEEIHRRLSGVATLVAEPTVRAAVMKGLSGLGDLERLAVRGSNNEATPRDLGNVRKGLFSAAAVIESLAQLSEEKRAPLLALDQVDLVEDLRDELLRALVERPPALAKEGAVFVEGYDPELDRLGRLRSNGTEQIAQLEARLRESTGIGNLRIKYTRVFGWYVEVSRSAMNRVPQGFVRKQTVAGGERYTFDELDDLAHQLESAEGDFRERELLLLSQLADSFQAAAARVHRLAALLAEIDVSASLAIVAAENDYCRPDVTKDDVLRIEDGRHPVVEKLAAEGRFVPNDVQLCVGETHLWLISGPNMAGKSTFLRQVALTVILAQMGSFVPARSAHIGLVDRVLSRVGASDNLAGGESTFMVEMRETASILRNATSRSLVILDEVGRGTSTFDGLAIAFAVAEHLDEVVRCRALFATHYHELTALGDSSPTVENHCVTAREHEGDVIFLHRVVPGAASRSYGVAVAQLAGLPEAVLARARAVLATLETGGHIPGTNQGSAAPREGVATSPQLGLFREQDPMVADLLGTLRELEPDRMTGLEALALLHQISARLKKKPS